MSEQRAPQHCCNNVFCPCKDTPLPESQPSPSGDAKDLAIYILKNWAYKYVHPEQFNAVNPQSAINNAINKSAAKAEDWLRSHDAKVSGQAEKRLHRINELLELLRNCGMQGRAQSYVQEIRELVAALQESPSDK